MPLAFAGFSAARAREMEPREFQSLYKRSGVLFLLVEGGILAMALRAPCVCACVHCSSCAHSLELPCQFPAVRLDSILQ